MAYYQVTCTKSWTSFRPGSEETVCGSYATIEQANIAIRRKRANLEGQVEDDGWTGGQLQDGRLWYNCDDWGHEEYYKLRIRKLRVSGPNPLLAHHLPASKIWADDGDRLELPARMAQELDASDQFQLLLENDSAREEAIDHIAQELDASDRFRLTLENDSAREEVIDYIAQELDASDRFRLILENDSTREEVLDRIGQESDVSEWFELVLENDNAREEVLDRIQLDHFRQYASRDSPEFGDVALEKILDTEGGAEQILDYLRRSTRKNDHQFEEFVLGKIMQADGGVEEILETITSRKATALSNKLRAGLKRDIRRKPEVKLREEIGLGITRGDEGAGAAIRRENVDELTDFDGERRARKRAKIAY